MKITKRIFRKTNKRSSKRKKKYNKSKKTYIKGAGGVLSLDINMTLHEASQEGKTAIVKQLINNGADVNEPDIRNLRPLHYACIGGHTQTAITLIKKGADVNALAGYYMTPLHYACVEGKTETAMALIERGADIHAETETKRTPLDIACVNGYTNVAKLLIDKGANPKLCIGKSERVEQEITSYIHEKFGNSDFLNMVYEGTEHAKIVEKFKRSEEVRKASEATRVSDADLYKALYIIVLTNNISLLEALIEGVGFEEIMKYKSPERKQNILYLVTEISSSEMLKLLGEANKRKTL